MTLNNICDFHSSDSAQLGRHVLTLKTNVLTAIFSSTLMVGLFTLLPIYNTTWHYNPVYCDLGPCGSAVGWVTALQAWRLWVWFFMMSLKFFIDIIVPAALWPWGHLNFLEKWIPGIFPGGKGGWCAGLITLPPSRANCLEIWEPKTFWNPQDLSRPV